MLRKIGIRFVMLHGIVIGNIVAHFHNVAGGFYSKEYQDAKDLPENAKVGIPSDPTNDLLLI
jgi:hypothetical protein